MTRLDYHPRYLELLNGLPLDERAHLAALQEERRAALSAEKWAPFAQALASAPQAPTQAWRVAEQGAVELGRDWSSDNQNGLQSALAAFCPWKKGPFTIGAQAIDAEWRSDQKWDRLVPHIGSLRGQTIADVGCHNGYFMFRMLEQEPAFVLGLEPVPKHYFCFHMLRQWAGDVPLDFDLLGVEHLQYFPASFDTIFLLGILYHHQDPLGLLRQALAALKPGGQLVIDCQGIGGDEPNCLVPASRYAQARGIWFLPTAQALEHWLRRSGFSRLNTFYSEPLQASEQRRCPPWADIPSLSDFLDAADQTKTIEGYPAPWRHYVIAKP